MHYYQFNIADYRKDTVHLTPIEHYFYRQMLDNYYLSEQPIPNDESKIMRSLCVRNADDMQAVKNVLSDFFFLTENGYIHKRCDVEIEAYHSKSKSASESAKARWANKNKVVDANALRTDCEGNANHKPLTNNHKPVFKNITQKTEFFAGIDKNLVDDYLAVRKSKRAPKVSQTVYDGLVRESNLADIDLSQALRVCIERNWVGFKAEWYQPVKTNNSVKGLSIAEQNKINTARAKERLFGLPATEKDITDASTRL